jgi:hypothetical protein
VQLALFPQESVAVQVIVVVPCGYGAPSGWLSLRTPFTVTGPPQLSLTVGLPGLTMAVHPPAAAITETADGQAMVGGVVSFTVIVCVQVALLPQESDAV